MTRWRGLVLAAACLWTGTATSAVSRTRALEFVRSPYAGAYEPQGVDERGLWMEIDELERNFRGAPGVLHNPELTQYLHGVLCRAVGDERCAAVRIYVLKVSSFNASMAPNGLMIVHTGLLARVHSEAELAAVLGHEFGHFEKRHSLYRFRQARKGSDIAAWIGLIGGYTGTPTSNIQMALIGGMYAFSRAQEAEADAMSVEYLRASPYRLRASRIWQRLTEEQDALRKERGLRKLKKTSPSLLDTHPANAERIAFHTIKEAEIGDSGADESASFAKATAPFLLELFDPLIRDNDFGAADYVLRARGEALGWSAQLHYLRGELYRLRGNPRDFVTALGFFEQAAALPDAVPESWRGLGLCALRTGDTARGHAALAEYIKRKPDARDVATINLLLGS